MPKLKYWVSELHPIAQNELILICTEKLKNEGYDEESIFNFIKDIKNEKLLNLEELMPYEKIIKLCEL